MIPLDEAVVSATKKVVPSVVHVSSVQIANYMFQRVPVQGVGSGVIVDPDGYILTNAHVVAEAEEIEITLENGQKHRGKIAGIDRSMDTAVVRVDALNLPVPKFGDSDRLEAGQLAIAIGNPLGLAGGPTVTVGVVSAVNRSLQTDRGYIEGMIQTDAAINPGNSGGPLVDSEGRVIGINTAIVPYAQGIGFAIPINAARKIAEDIILHGEVIRPWLGISGMDITKKVVTYYGLPVEKGAIVMRVAEGSPAKKSGIREGDILLSADGKEIGGMRELTQKIGKSGVGKKIVLGILRGKKRMEIEAKLEKMPA